MDTDSFIVLLKTENIYGAKDVEKIWYLKNIGLMKDELGRK